MSRGRALVRAPEDGPSKSHHEGFVLMAALLAIVLIGALAAGALFAATEDTRAGAAGVGRDVALIAAESAIGITIRDRTPALPAVIGATGTTSARVDASGAPVIVYITRLDSTTYWIVSDVVANPGRWGARRRIGVVVMSVPGADGSITMDPISERSWAELF